MIIGLISDIHGNLPALEAVFEAMPEVDAIVCAGDIVGYNPWHRECLEWIRDRDILTVQGNHDRAVAGASTFHFSGLAGKGVEHARAQLKESDRYWLGELPEQRRLFDDRMQLVHGHPADPDRYTYPEAFSPRLLGDADILVMGHTHVQHAETYEEGIVCNPGSVGQPRDGDPRAAFAIVDLEAMEISCHRVEYPIERVQERIREEGLPERLASRLATGR